MFRQLNELLNKIKESLFVGLVKSECVSEVVVFLFVLLHLNLTESHVVLLMLYQGTRGLFLFIDEIPSHRDQTASSG